MTKLRECPMCWGEMEICLDEGILLCKDCGFNYNIAESIEGTIEDFNTRKSNPRLQRAIEEIEEKIRVWKYMPTGNRLDAYEDVIDIIYKHIPEARDETLEDMLDKVTEENKHEVEETKFDRMDSPDIFGYDGEDGNRR